jgi:hypothetical protein
MEIVSLIASGINSIIQAVKKRKNRKKKYILKEEAEIDGLPVRELITEVKRKTIRVFDRVTHKIYNLRRTKSGLGKLVAVKRLSKDRVVMATRGESKRMLYIAGKGMFDQSEYDKIPNIDPIVKPVAPLRKNNLEDSLPPIPEEPEVVKEKKRSPYMEFDDLTITNEEKNGPIDIPDLAKMDLDQKVIEGLKKLSALQSEQKQKLDLIRKAELEGKKVVYEQKLKDLESQLKAKLDENNALIKKVEDQRAQVLKLIADLQDKHVSENKALSEQLDSLKKKN